jgi:2-polyprenyl-3-methyl-5-hydroxy-6-metoxy-1,4-benzoquinol methylase
LKALGIRSLLDIACGDFNWLSEVDLSGIDYIGWDDDPDNLEAALMRETNAASVVFQLADAVAAKMPQVDLILCREFLQHLPNDQVRKVLDNTIESGARYLLATSHNNNVNPDIQRPGDFRELNLTLPPFDLPKPGWSIPDRGYILGLWKRNWLQ